MAKENIGSNWKITELEKICNITMGQSPSSAAYNEDAFGVPLIQGNNDIKEGKTISRIYTTEITKMAEKGDIIMTVRAPVGRVGFAHAKICIGRGVCSINVKNNNPRFIYYLLKFHRWNSLEQGSTFTAINSADVKKCKIFLPSVAEQNRIVAVLDVWDETIEKLSDKIGLKKKIKKGLMQKLLTEGTCSDNRYDKSQITCIGKICEVKRGGSPRPIQDYLTKEENGLNWLRIGDVNVGSKYIYNTKEKIRLEGLNKTALVNDGDFILSNSMSFGRPYIMKTNACIHDGWLTLKNISSAVDKDYLYYLLLSNSLQNKFKSLSAGSGVQNLKKETVSAITIKLPSWKEQKAIAHILAAADNEIAALERKLLLLKEQRKYLLNNLIAGRIRTPENLLARKIKNPQYKL